MNPRSRLVLRGCGRCGGALAYDEDCWRCLTCGRTPIQVAPSTASIRIPSHAARLPSRFRKIDFEDPRLERVG